MIKKKTAKNKVETIKNCGRIHFEDKFSASERSKVTRDFFRKLAKNIVKNTVAFADEYSSVEVEYNLRWHERGLYSLLAASIHQITPVHISELPVNRASKRKDDSAGRADIWAHYRKCDFLLEIKRHPYAIRTAGANQNIQRSWGQLQEQVKQLKESLSGWSKRPIRAGLYIVFPYYSYQHNLSAKPAHDISHIDNRVGDYCWAAHWELPERLRNIPTNPEKTRFEYTPFIHFLVHLEANENGDVS